jgi:glutathione S-transferase
VHDATPELLQFPYSHYNEKVRWALDWKRLPHRRTDLLPGPHMLRIRRLTGQSQLPVLRLEGRVLHGSARILDELERLHPEPPLCPADPALRRRALEIQAHFDQEVGPRVRLALFAVMLDTPDYVCRVFASQRSPAARALYRASFPLVAPVMKRGMGIRGPRSVEEAERVTREAFDFVARESQATGQLAGDAFSVADLAAASLLAPATDPSHPAMCRPRPMPAAVEAWLEGWSKHPGAVWVLEQYRRHRPESCALAPAS